MRILSIPATVVLFLWDGIPIAIWLGIFLFLGYQGGGMLGVPAALGCLAGVVVAATLSLGLRPVRKILQISGCRTLAGSWARPLMEVGVWKLLKVAYRFWPQDVNDFVGFTALHQTYDRLGASGRRQMLEIVGLFAQAGPVTQEAHRFLEDINDTNPRK